MKKIISDRDALVRSIMMLCVFIPMTAIMVIAILKNRDSIPIASVVFGILFFAISLLSLWVLNRDAAVITVEGDTVTRRGLLFGFRKTVKLSEITRVAHLNSSVWGDRFYLIDSSQNPYATEQKRLNPEKKEGYLTFTYSEYHLAFLRTFWSGEITGTLEERTLDDDA
ncbi:MAG: hypothetical protein IJW46_05860 [Clostridia bacterium]|nr:hypothetical protein [Clostridia bacterium]